MGTHVAEALFVGGGGRAGLVLLVDGANDSAAETDVVLESDLGALDLTRTGPATKLPVQFGTLFVKSE